jgi:gamma-resorcylate decarboxylase
MERRDILRAGAALGGAAIIGAMPGSAGAQDRAQAPAGTGGEIKTDDRPTFTVPAPRVAKKIALEEHIESPDFPATGSHPFVREDYFQDVERRLQDYKLRLEGMDKAGIGATIVSLTQPGIEAILDKDKAVEMSKRTNDHIANFFVKNAPGRLYGFAAVAMQDPRAAADELERAVKTLGAKGALVNGYTNIDDENEGRYLDEPPVWEFWERVAALNVPVYLHPRIPMPNQQRMYAGYPALVGAPWGFGIETSTHAVRLILSGLFDKYPNLTVILGHPGEALPFTLPRLESRLRHVNNGSHGKHVLRPTEYLRRNFFITTAGSFRTQTLLDTIGEVGSDRVMFSVDYPYESMQEGADWFDSASISEDDRLKIGRTNAAKLFNIT